MIALLKRLRAYLNRRRIAKLQGVRASLCLIQASQAQDGECDEEVDELISTVDALVSKITADQLLHRLRESV